MISSFSSVPFKNGWSILKFYAFISACRGVIISLDALYSCYTNHTARWHINLFKSSVIHGRKINFADMSKYIND